MIKRAVADLSRHYGAEFRDDRAGVEIRFLREIVALGTACAAPYMVSFCSQALT